jgi:methyl-accepting chemotaxis protein
MPEADQIRELAEKVAEINTTVGDALTNIQTALAEGVGKLEALLVETQTYLERIADAVEGWESPGPIAQ